MKNKISSIPLRKGSMGLARGIFIGGIVGGRGRKKYSLVKGAQADVDAIYGKAYKYLTARLRRAVDAIVTTIPYPQRDIRMKGGVS